MDSKNTLYRLDRVRLKDDKINRSITLLAYVGEEMHGVVR